MENENQIYPYTKTTRFAVVKKLPTHERWRCNFKYLHETKESAETEALRLAAKFKNKFFVVEIISVANVADSAPSNEVAKEATAE